MVVRVPPVDISESIVSRLEPVLGYRETAFGSAFSRWRRRFSRRWRLTFRHPAQGTLEDLAPLPSARTLMYGLRPVMVARGRAATMPGTLQPAPVNDAESL